MKLFTSIAVLNFLIVSLSTFASPTSTVKGLTIPNSHELTNKVGRVIRGSQPAAKVSELAAIGVTDVLIFKNETKHEVQDEVAALKALKINATTIPFEWQKIEDFEAACAQAVDAEILLEKIAAQKGKSIFFHCTVGEDRTGLLAGLFRISTQGWTPEKAFKEELCPNGFADGNPKKPPMVASTVRTELYPVYVMAAAAIQEAHNKASPLSKNFCRKEILATLAKPYPHCK